MADLPAEIVEVLQRFKKQYVDGIVSPELVQAEDDEYHSTLQVHGVPRTVPLNKIEMELRCLYPGTIEFVYRNEDDEDSEPIISLGVTSRKTRESLLSHQLKLLGSAITLTVKPTPPSIETNKTNKKGKPSGNTKKKSTIRNSKKSSNASSTSSRSRNRSISNQTDHSTATMRCSTAPAPFKPNRTMKPLVQTVQKRPVSTFQRKIFQSTTVTEKQVTNRIPRTTNYNTPGMTNMGRYNRPATVNLPYSMNQNKNKRMPCKQGWNTSVSQGGKVNGINQSYPAPLNSNKIYKPPGYDPYNYNITTPRPHKSNFTSSAGSQIKNVPNVPSYRTATFGTNHRSNITSPYMYQYPYTAEAEKCYNDVIKGLLKKPSISNTHAVQQPSFPCSPLSPNKKVSKKLISQRKSTTTGLNFSLYPSDQETESDPDVLPTVSEIDLAPVDSQTDILSGDAESSVSNHHVAGLCPSEEYYSIKPTPKPLRPREKAIRDQRKLLKSIRSLLLCAQKSRIYP